MTKVIIIIVLGLALTFAFYLIIKALQGRKNTHKSEEHGVRGGAASDSLFSPESSGRKDYFSQDRRSVIDLIAPNGLNPNPMS